MDKKLAAILIVSVLLVGAAAGWSVGAGSSRSGQTASIPIRANTARYEFINPLLYSESAKDTSAPFRSLSSSLSGFIASTTANNGARSVSVYFRDLNSGGWTGIDENGVYAPSSMLKVIAMMAALKLAEADPATLNEVLTYHPSDQSLQYYKPDDGLVKGNYKLDELIGAMIKDSDNDALDAVLSDPKIDAEFSQVYALFRLPKPSATTTTDFMSPLLFSGIFRSLYNSSFFQWDLSEQVLRLLSQTTFARGLVAGVPRDTTVAHKFGENTDVSLPSGTVIDRELHDCGIVYYPGRPYLLCVMTRGRGFPDLETTISGISRLVWDSVSRQNAGR
jgi:beta-lactamase class A